DVGVYASIVEHETEVWSGEVRVDGAFDMFGLEHRAIFGLEANRRNQDSRSGSAYLGTANLYAGNFASLGTVPGGSLPITFDVTDASQNRGAYAQVALSVTERTKLLIGGRHDEARQ